MNRAETWWQGPRVLCWWQGGKQIQKDSGRGERNAPGAGGKQRRKQACPAPCGRRTALLREGDTWAEFWRVSRSLPGRERGRRCRQQEAAGAEMRAACERAACERAWQETEGEARGCRSWQGGWVSARAVRSQMLRAVSTGVRSQIYLFILGGLLQHW